MFSTVAHLQLFSLGWFSSLIFFFPHICNVILISTISTNNLKTNYFHKLSELNL